VSISSDFFSLIVFVFKLGVTGGWGDQRTAKFKVIKDEAKSIQFVARQARYFTVRDQVSSRERYTDDADANNLRRTSHATRLCPLVHR